MTTVADALSTAAARLAEAGVDGARGEARLLLAHAAGISLDGLIAYPERAVHPAAQARLAALVARRARREPLAHILGEREFWSLPFRVTPATLIPRPDSEALIEAALAGVADRAAPLRLLDLGTGTGCLLLTLLKELPRATGLGIDVSEAALAVARDNAQRLGLQGRASFRPGHWTDGLDESFNLVITNPPYIESGTVDRLAPEVALFEPRLALDGGADGLAAYRAIAAGLPNVLAGDGVAVFEVGAGQAERVAGILADAGLRVTAWRRDLAGVARCLAAVAGAGVQPKKQLESCA